MKAASVYAKLGWRVLPVEPGGKRPILKDWPTAASNDAATVAAWVAENPTANIGVATGDTFFVLDVDPDNGGVESLAALEVEHGPLPVTVCQRTGSGGVHYLFQLAEFPITNSAGKLGAGLDVRGQGGQIVAPPSVSAKGAYKWINAPFVFKGKPATEIAEAPEWLLSLLRQRAQPASLATIDAPRLVYPPPSAQVLGELDAALEHHGPAIQGQGGDQHTFGAAAKIFHDFALSEAEGWPIFVAWNETCQPPWSLEDLAVKMRNASKYATGAYGAKRAHDVVMVVKAEIARLRNAGEPSASDLEALVKMTRDLIAKNGVDPFMVGLIETELVSFTGLGVSKLKLPRGVVRSTEPRAVTKQDFDLSETGQPIMNASNAIKVLENQRALIRFDTFQQKIQIRTEKTPWRDYTDADDLRLTLEMQRKHGLNRMPLQIVVQAVQTYAHANAVNSVQDLFSKLETEWDHQQRIETFLSRAFGADDNEYTRAASVNFWRLMVARVLMPGCKADNMIVLEGNQGVKKSSALREIATPPLFTEAAESPHSKDFFLALSGKLIVEVGEMDSFSRGEVSAVKRVLSCAVDRFRAPYERVSRDWPRQGIFVGTTNSDEWARDDTGNRRFWPITCRTVDLELIRAERRQLFAEAINDVRAGLPWWEMPVEETRAEQEARRQIDPWQEALAPKLANVASLSATEVFDQHLMIEPSKRDKNAQMRLGSVLRQLGFKRGHVGEGRVRCWVRVS